MRCVSWEAERWHQCALYDRVHGVKECEGCRGEVAKQEEMELCKGATIKEIMTEESEGKNGTMTRWWRKKKQGDTHGSWTGAFSLKKRKKEKPNELNIAWSAGAGQAMVRHTKQPWQKH